jgi:hypothetical protein
MAHLNLQLLITRQALVLPALSIFLRRKMANDFTMQCTLIQKAVESGQDLVELELAILWILRRSRGVVLLERV